MADQKPLWNEKLRFPTADEALPLKGAEYYTVHTAREDGAHFLLGAAVVKHNGALRVCFSNSLKTENDDHTMLTEKVSSDGGKTWSERIIAGCSNGFGRSHGVYFRHGGQLFVFCPKARFDKIDRFPDLKTEGYILSEKGGYDPLGTVLDGDFWPMCEPVSLDKGRFLMAGLETDYGQAAVALSDGDPAKWRIVVIPSPDGPKNWGETTVIKEKGRLLLLSRGGGKLNILTSESTDGGETWSPLTESNFPIAHSKLYAGVLSNGLKYLVFNMRNGESRDTLAVAVGCESFDRVHLIRRGFTKKPRWWFQNEWCYPYAYEDIENGSLYVAYALDKENCEAVKIPVSALE